MKKLLLALSLVVSLHAQTISPSMVGQHMVTVSAQYLTDIGGNPVSGKIYFQPTSAMKIGGGGQASAATVSTTITAGAFSLEVVDTSQTNPENACYNVYAYDANGGLLFGSSLPGNGKGYQCVQVSSDWCNSSICNFDNYVPNSPNLPVTTSGSSGAAWGSITGVLSSQADLVSALALKQDVLTLPIPRSQGGTGTATPGLVAGTNVTISGTWPNQTINSTASGGSGSGIAASAMSAAALVTASGTAAIQTPNAAATMDSSGNITTSGTITANSFRSTSTTPGSDVLTAGSGFINGGQLDSNSAGFAAPAPGGTSYLLKLPSTITAGVLTASGPATADGVNESTITITSLPAAGALTGTIASGTVNLGTVAINSGACATVVTVSATGVTSTDVIQFGPNADITSVTGYAPSTAGGLAIYPYPTSDNVNFKVCNATASSITPGAVGLNWRVVR